MSYDYRRDRDSWMPAIPPRRRDRDSRVPSPSGSALARVRAACEALGLDPARVVHFEVGLSTDDGREDTHVLRVPTCPRCGGTA